MNFVVGDIVRGKRNVSYAYTTEKALMLVTRVIERDREMEVTILYHDRYGSEVGKSYPVRMSSFVKTTFEEFEKDFPTCYKMNNERLTSLLKKYPNRGEEKEEFDPNAYVLSDEMRKELLLEMRILLKKYHYNPTDTGLNKILNEWCKNKADLIRLFEKHPNYNGKFQIVFDHDFDRSFDRKAIEHFGDWLYSSEVNDLFKKEVKIGAFSFKELKKITNKLYGIYRKFDENVTTINGKTKEEYANEFARFDKLADRYRRDENVYIDSFSNAYDKKLYNSLTKIDNVYTIIDSSHMLEQHVNDYAKDYINERFPDAKIRKGQKMSRAINKILCLLGVDKAPNYNKEFAKFADAINPLKIKRHTVISIHPVDYFTMSFGNSWSSCHTIDRKNDRGIDNGHSYRGCSSSGTESYMLDKTSCVFYTVKSEYNGNTLELEDKINRCMFHYYDNRLLQGRVYPQSHDSGSNNLYKDIREVAQKVFADMLEVPNYWTNKAGTEACDDATTSDGTHFKDYYNYRACNVSTLKDDRTDHERIPIGHYPICPNCGYEHDREANIECDYCSR